MTLASASVAAVVGAFLVVWEALAHVGGLSDAVTATGVPSWLTVLTGGVLVGASFLFNSLLTDHEAIRAVNAWRAHLPAPATVYRAGATALSAVGVAVLALVLAASVLGPAEPTRNFAILVVWVGWWAGYAMSTYVVGNSWSAVNPWRTLARLLPTSGHRDVPESYGAWPSVVGLVVLVWVEVVSPLAADATRSARSSSRTPGSRSPAPTSSVRARGSSASTPSLASFDCTAASRLSSATATASTSASLAPRSPNETAARSAARRRSSSRSSG
ncbi:hypothetical protein [Halobacterium bonnevillei]|uniref:Uncharacterized protein n=1 Tax=Halobacterium bonnevillei TaxID=2692200 RepID=A0A6B0SNB2_9EURY|nr:hypothetical protein [Halobacterium bonnevillei]MXR20472.1 hypothetical protein [Halobacterium bonnevillei]